KTWPVTLETGAASLSVSYAYHALKKGRFSGDDAVAKGRWATWCPSAPKSLRENASTFGEVAARILCARSWGMSESRLRAQLRNECASFIDVSGWEFVQTK